MQLPALILGLAALSNAAAVPRTVGPQGEVLDLLLPTPIPLSDDERASRLSGTTVKPKIITWTVDEVLAAGGNVTEAPLFRPPGVHDALNSRAVHGADDRYLETQLVYPFVAMGRIRITTGSSSSWCSGALVGGRVVATARHCLASGASYSFSPAYYNGDRLPTSPVQAIINLAGSITDGCSYRDDWALLILSNNLAATSGYLGVRNWDPALENQDVFSTYGYPQDKSPSGQLPYAHHFFRAWLPGGCSNGGPVYHLGDTSPGQSGSTVYRNDGGNPYQYGVHVASSSASGLWAHGPSFLNAVVRARSDFP